MPWSGSCASKHTVRALVCARAHTLALLFLYAVKLGDKKPVLYAYNQGCRHFDSCDQVGGTLLDNATGAAPFLPPSVNGRPASRTIRSTT